MGYSPNPDGSLVYHPGLTAVINFVRDYDRNNNKENSK
jgi:hypothetical protein